MYAFFSSTEAFTPAGGICTQGLPGLSVTRSGNPPTRLASFSSLYISHARRRVLALPRQVMLRACSLATFKDGIRIAMSTAMMAMTTSSSIRVNARRSIVVSPGSFPTVPMPGRPVYRGPLLFYRQSEDKRIRFHTLLLGCGHLRFLGESRMMLSESGPWNPRTMENVR